MGAVRNVDVLKATVLEVLNAEAHTVGAPPVTDRMLEDWIYEDLLSAPEQKGRGPGPGAQFQYAVSDIERGLELVRNSSRLKLTK